MAKIATIPATKNGGGIRRSPESRNEQAEIEKMAYQYFIERGYQHGHHDEDWLRAENTIRNRKRL